MVHSGMFLSSCYHNAVRNMGGHNEILGEDENIALMSRKYLEKNCLQVLKALFMKSFLRIFSRLFVKLIRSFSQLILQTICVFQDLTKLYKGYLPRWWRSE